MPIPDKELGEMMLYLSMGFSEAIRGMSWCAT